MLFHNAYNSMIVYTLIYFVGNVHTVPADGKSYPKKLQVVTIHYTASCPSKEGDGKKWKVFDSSHKRGKPLTFRLGCEQVIPGLEQGVAQVSLPYTAFSFHFLNVKLSEAQSVHAVVYCRPNCYNRV